MSQDQKPGKVRLLDAGGEQSRRRGDTPPIIIDGTAAGSVAASPAPVPVAISGALSSAMTSRAGMILALLFVLGCGAGGAAVAVFLA